MRRLLALAALLALLVGGALPAMARDLPTADEVSQLVDSGDVPLEWRDRAEAILKDDPDSPVGHMLMGLVLHRTEGDLPRARYHLDRARRLGRDAGPEGWQFYQLALFELRLVLGEMDLYEEQVKILDEYSQSLGSNFFAAEYAWPLMKLGREVEAREKLSQAFQQASPLSQVIAWNTLGALEMETGNVRASYQAFQRLLEEARRNGWEMDCTYLRNGGEASLTLAKYDEAERLFREATRFFNEQTFSNPYWDLAGLYLTQGRFAEAVESTERMHQWSRAIKPFLYQQSMADNQQRTGELLLELGYVEEALAQLDLLVQRPDRRGGTSGKKDQSEAGNLMIWRAALLAERERVAERMASARGLEWWKLAWRRQVLGGRASAAGRRVAALAVANDRVQGSLRPYWAGSIIMGEWHRPDLVELYGPGVTAAALRDLREKRPEKVELEEPFLEVLDAEVSVRQGDRAGALAHLERALATLPDAEVLMRARVHARMGQLEEASGNRPQALRHFQLAMDKAPGMLRMVRTPLPVTVSGDTNATMREAAAMIGRSPRFRRVGDGLPLQLALAGSSLQATLLGADGTVLARATTPLKKDLHASASALVEELHRQAFSPRIDLSQAELNSLDGSNFSGSTASDSFRDLFQQPQEPPGERI